MKRKLAPGKEDYWSPTQDEIRSILQFCFPTVTQNGFTAPNIVSHAQ